MSGKYALVIANTDYSDPALSQLTAPGRDAEDFARVLRDKEIAAFDDVKVLLNNSEPQVREAIDEFFDQKKRDDLLILYFSGHGVRDEVGSLYLALKNTTRARLRATALKSDFIREAMDQSYSKRIVLILDCCNSGAFAQGTKAIIGGSVGTASAFGGTGYGRIVLTASDSTQFAWEGDKVIGGETQNSLFTHFLVKGLEGEADHDYDGRITVDELFDYAYEQIVTRTPNQTPSKHSDKQQGEIVLRQGTRISNTKPIFLPNELIEAMEDSRTFVREGAVTQLEKLFKGKNLGLAHAAREALEKIAAEDDSRRVAQLAAQALETIGQVEQVSTQKAEEERIVREKIEAQQKANAESKAKEEAQRLAAQKAKDEQFMREKIEAEQRTEAERKAKEETQRLAAQKEEERKAKEVTSSNIQFISWWKRILIGAATGITLGVIGSILDSSSFPVGPATFFFSITCGIAGFVIYPRKASVFLLVLGFFIAGIIVVNGMSSSGSSSDFMIGGIFFGIPGGALLSRILYWLEIIK